MKKTFSEGLILSLSFSMVCLSGSLAAAKNGVFVDSSKMRICSKGNISCGSVEVTEPDRRIAPEIKQPQIESAVMGSCGSDLPLNASYRARILGLSCETGDSKVYSRGPIQYAMEKKDEARQVMDSTLDDVTKRTEAQNLLRTELKYENQFQIPVVEKWEYISIEGDFNGPLENYETTCKMEVIEHYEETEDVYDNVCDPETNSGGGSYGYSGSGYSGGSGSSSSSGSSSRSRDSDRQRGSSSGEIKEKSKSNYQKRNNSMVAPVATRWIASCRRVKVGTRKVPRTRQLSDVVGRCISQRGTWRTFEVVKSRSRSCGQIPVQVSAQFEHDQRWNPTHPDYLDILPNKFDLLPGESEAVNIKVEGSGKTIRANVLIDNAWNDYSVQLDSSSVARCELGPKQLSVNIQTNNRIKRKAPNPFKLPGESSEDAINMSVLDSKGRPQRLVLIDQAREFRLEQSLNSRRFSEEEKGKKAFWVGVQFRMRLYKVTGKNSMIAVTMPNQFSTNQADIFGDELSISLGGEGGMDRLYRPGGPIEGIFGGLYKHLGVELSPNTEYKLEVRSAQREFPFYESTCETGDISCLDESAKAVLFSDPIWISFKTGKTERSFLKTLKDLQISIF